MSTIGSKVADEPQSAQASQTAPVMRREERTMPDGRRMLLYHFERPVAPTPPPNAEKKEPTDG